MTQPEALRLADELEAPVGTQSIYSVMLEAAAELRRLHAELERCKQVCAATAEGWRVERDALLGVLKMLVLATKDVSVGHYNEEVHDIALSKACAAIKAAEENP